MCAFNEICTDGKDDEAHERMLEHRCEAKREERRGDGFDMDLGM